MWIQFKFKQEEWIFLLKFPLVSQKKPQTQPNTFCYLFHFQLCANSWIYDHSLILQGFRPGVWLVFPQARCILRLQVTWREEKKECFTNEELCWPLRTRRSGQILSTTKWSDIIHNLRTVLFAVLVVRPVWWGRYGRGRRSCRQRCRCLKLPGGWDQGKRHWSEASFCPFLAQSSRNRGHNHPTTHGCFSWRPESGF